VVEGVGIFHPDLLPLFDTTVWIDVPLEVASSRGKARDRERYGVDNDVLWDAVWVPNDTEYFERFRPNELADVLLDLGDPPTGPDVQRNV